MTKLSLGMLLLWVGTGCLGARTAVVGRTAHALGPGNVEIGLSGGAQYVSGADYTSRASLAGGGTPGFTSGSTRVQIPVAEGNAGLGITDSLDLNFHYSVAGIQPGVRVVVSKGPLTLAVMPELGLGLGFINAFASTTGPNGQTISTSSNAAIYNMLLGARLLASHESGLYGSAGYEHQRVGIAGAGAGVFTVQYHSLSMSAGYDWVRGPLRIRPELALSFSPSVSAGTGGSATEFLVLPNITVALLSPVFKFSSEPAK